MRRYSFVLVLLFCFTAACAAQDQLAVSSPPARLVTQPINEGQLVTLHGNMLPIAQPQHDRGPVPRSFPAQRILLLLSRSPAQQAALTQFLHYVHTPGNPAYHQWLTPAQFGALYGPADADIATVEAWLGQQGFTVKGVNPGKTTIEFSGTAGQILQAFRTAVHTYAIGDQLIHANSSDPQIPAALAPVVTGLTPLTDLRPRSNLIVAGHAAFDPKTHAATPLWTFNSSFLALAPGDFAVQYDLSPLYSSGITGGGVTIGIIGDSNIDPSVLATYRSLFSLAANTVNVVIDGNDPGQNGDLGESYLDVEVSGSVAPAATVDLYTAADTALQSGLDLAAQHAVDDDTAAVLSVSYGTCEQNLGTAGNAFWAGIWEQAAAQGQTALVAAGDGGAAGCDDFDYDQPAQYGLAVNGIGSTPWNLSVGGLDFYYTSYNQSQSAQLTQLGQYWNLAITPNPAVSLLQHVPEQPWNLPFGLNLQGGGVPDLSSIVAGSGGVSSCASGTASSDGMIATCAGGYPKPSWQSGSGVPADNGRDLPDVSLFASSGANGTGYPICAGTDDCVEINGGITITVAGGTSASTPAMAGILALVNQKYGRQGQADFVLYPLAAQHPTVFHDIDISSNSVPCQAGSPDCAVSTHDDNTNGYLTLGYYAGPGYDQATGLGSIDANLLVSDWTSLHFTPTTTALTLSQTTFAHGTPVTADVSVTGSDGTPTGDVALITTATPASNTGLGSLTLSAGLASASLSDLPGGRYAVTARYGGDNTFASSQSAAVNVDVTPESSTLSVSGNIENYWAKSAVWQPIAGGTYVYGNPVAIDAQPRGAHAQDGAPTGTVSFVDSASTGAISSGAIAVNRQGLAEWAPSTGFLVGTHSIAASYSGDSSFSPSSAAAPFTFTVTKCTPQTSLSALVRVGLGVPTVITAQIGIYGVGVAPTGTVTFFNGATNLGTVTLTPYTGNPGAYANLTVSTLPLGVDTITAQYSGDANYDATSVPPTTITVQQPPNLTASASPTPVNQLQNFTVTATLAGASGQPAPSGAIGFRAVDSCCNTVLGASAISSGSASYTFSAGAFVAGPVIIAASYIGDTNYAPATASVSINVDPPFTLTGANLTLAPGATTGDTSVITVTPNDGFIGTVMLGCSLTSWPKSFQHVPTCTITPSVSITGAAAVTGTMTVQTTGPSSTALAPANPWFLGGGGSLLALAVFFGIPAHRRRGSSLLSLLLAVALLGSVAACGGNSTAGSTGASGGTSPGAYTFTVVGGYAIPTGGSWQETTPVTVTVTVE